MSKTSKYLLENVFSNELRSSGCKHAASTLLTLTETNGHIHFLIERVCVCSNGGVQNSLIATWIVWLTALNSQHRPDFSVAGSEDRLVQTNKSRSTNLEFQLFGSNTNFSDGSQS